LRDSEKTLKRDWSLTGVPVPRREKRIPVILSRKEVNTILCKVQNIRHAGLRRAMRTHPRELLELLMRLGTSTLLDVCENPKWLGALPGLSALLHTWTRQYWYHPHVHFIGTGGGINARGEWLDAHPRFLVPVHALSPVFRARFRDALRIEYPEIFATINPRVWKEKEWVVHSKPVGQGEKALRYLARYVYRVALSEHAILRVTSRLITLRYRKSDTNQPRTMRLAPHEFIRRFLQHVLPSGFRKVRYFGLHHSSKRPVLRLLQSAMSLRSGLPLPAPEPEPEALRPTCPDCNEPMVFKRRIRPLMRSIIRATPLNPRGPP